MSSSSCGDLSPSVCEAFQGVAEVCQEECLVQTYVVESCIHAWDGE